MKQHLLCLLFLTSTALIVPGISGAETDEPERRSSPNNLAVPVGGVDLAVKRHDRGAARFPDEFRTVDGTANNGENPTWGAVGTPFLRSLPASYSDGVESPAGPERPSAREISNLVGSESETVLAPRGMTNMVWQWGQFLDHDIDLTPAADPEEPFDVAVPVGDPFFDPTEAGDRVIPLDRSSWAEVEGVREQLNAITAFIDASNVYGSDEERAEALRRLDGTGRLKTSRGQLLPYNEVGLPNAPAAAPSFFLAGDFRANEQVGLTAMHTLFVREHNRWAAFFRDRDPAASGDELYQSARAMVAAEIQAITYREFLPLILGRDAIPPYEGYRPEVDPSISNEFATAAYRFGHTMLPEELWRMSAEGEAIEAGNLPLAAAFFAPSEVESTGIEPILRGLCAQRAMGIDNQVVDAVRNFLFGPPGSGGFDLASLNIQRGRDHGLPSFNQARVALGLEPLRRFRDVNPANPEVGRRLAEAYATVDDVDLWVGGLAEARVPGAEVGPTFHRILVDQFQRLRDGDRFWYQSYLPRDLVDRVERSSLERIIRRNTRIGEELARNPWRVTADR